MKILIIDTNRWLRGEGPSYSALQRESDGKRCCLGFLLLALGIEENSIKGRTFPCDVDSPDHAGTFERMKLISVHKDSHIYQGDAARQIGHINDAVGYVPADRMLQLQKEFASFGIDLLFSEEPQVLANHVRQQYAYYEWERQGRPENSSEYFWALAEEAVKAP